MRSWTAVALVAMVGAARGGELRELWDWSDPAGSERRFRALLGRSAAAGDPLAHAELVAQVARAQGLQGHFDQARETLSDLAPLAERAGPGARAHLRLELGRVLRSSGNPAGALPHFEEARRLAQEAGLAGLAVDAAHMVALAQPELEDQVARGREALALAEGSSDPGARRWRASLLNNLGWSLHDLGRYREALEHFRRAVPLRREQGEAGPLREARWAVARALRSLGRHAEALEIQRELAAELAAAGEQDGFVDEELGELLLATGDPAAARPHLARAGRLLADFGWVEADRLARLVRLGAGTGASP